MKGSVQLSALHSQTEFYLVQDLNLGPHDPKSRTLNNQPQRHFIINLTSKRNFHLSEKRPLFRREWKVVYSERKNLLPGEANSFLIE